MLLHLRIENFALIDQLDIEFDQGLNLLTGETGAGKSIIIDAVNLVLGGRGGGDLVRRGKDKAVIEAEFLVPAVLPLLNVCAEYGIEMDEEDNRLVLCRILTQQGRNSYRINGRAATLGMLKAVGQWLLDIHGQYDNQSLMKASRHILLLDSFGQQELKQLKETYHQVYKQWKGLRKQLTDLEEAKKERARKIDLLQYQVDEIAAAELKVNEEAELMDERVILASAEKLAKVAAGVYEKLSNGTGHGMGALDTIGEVMEDIKEIAQIDPKMRPLEEVVTNAFYQLEDAAHQLRDYCEEMTFEPERLSEVEERLDLLHQLKRKYGDSVEEVLGFWMEAQRELDQLVNSEQLSQDLQRHLQAISKQLETVGAELSERRKDTAQQLEAAITQELRDLNMPQVAFKVQFNQTAEPTGQGFDEVEFLISPNPGEQLKPLAKIASGGEMARIMLAIKVILAQADGIPTLIFDEVDAGVGGRAAQAVGEKLATLSTDCQVLCVTHSPQVTSFADKHFCISKESNQVSTRTVVEPLDRNQRLQELARMLGGANITTLSLEHANEMLQAAEKLKKR